MLVRYIERDIIRSAKLKAAGLLKGFAGDYYLAAESLVQPWRFDDRRWPNGCAMALD